MIARLGAATPDQVISVGATLVTILMHDDHVERSRIRVYAVDPSNQGLLLAWQALAPRSPVWAQMRVVPDAQLVVALADEDEA